MKKEILPKEIISYVQSQADNLAFGSIHVQIHLRDGKPRWEISWSVSIIDALSIGINVKETDL